MIPREEWSLNTSCLGRRVLVFDCVDSTNTQAAQRANDRTNDGLVLLADHQTAGRGQHGRSWTCQPGLGVLMSVLLFPPPALRRPVVLAAWAAFGVCKTIAALTRLPTEIKWPNDVLIFGRKVCGILIESKIQPTGEGDPGELAMVVGIGLNVNQSADALAEARLPYAGSLAAFTDRPWDRDSIARHLIEELDATYAELARGWFADLEAGWRDRTGLVGQRVQVECTDAWITGRLLHLSFDGLVLELDSGERRGLLPEEVKHVIRI